MASAAIPTKTIAMEALLPQAVAEQWTAATLGQHAGVHRDTATRFLAHKRQQAQQQNHVLIHKLSAKAGAIFNRAGQRNLKRLSDLEAVPLDKWDKEHDRIERHVLGSLKTLMDWSKMGLDADPGAADPPQLSDGL